MIASLLVRLKSWAWMAVAVLSLLAGAYAMGSRSAARSSELRRSRQLDKAGEAVRRVEEELDGLGDSDLRERSKRWVRNP